MDFSSFYLSFVLCIVISSQLIRYLIREQKNFKNDDEQQLSLLAVNKIELGL